MKLSTILPLLLVSEATAQATLYRSSSKRGLVFVPTVNIYDYQVFVGAKGYSDLTWYYNYAVTPSAAYQNRTQEEFEYVPMLFSAPASSSDNTFLNSVKTLISNGRNITHVMAYNEPDGNYTTGGSNVDPVLAATTWIRQIVPLQKMGIKCGAPAVTGSPGGFTWLSKFYAACTAAGTNCTADFIPVHWYGNFEGLASHMGQMTATYPNTSLWITEYAYDNQNLQATQSFFNQSADYFDRLPFVERYSYFGSFRSSVSNVGPNAAMLNSQGQLTDIGSWYLGGAATNVIPSSAMRLAAEPLWTAVLLAVGACVWLN